jgi:glycosyltransferase involved in cell wall biosynthesis
MKIMHTEASSGWGGQEIRILTESQAFMRHQHEVILAADIDSEIIKRASIYGVKAFPIPLKKKRWQEFKALRALIENQRPDIISCHSSTDHWLSAAARLTTKHQPAIVRTRHISAPVTRNWTTRWLYNSGTDGIMTTGEAIRDQLLSDHFVQSERIHSVPTGIDVDRYVPGDLAQAKTSLGLPSSQFVFGIVATLRSWKGHSYLIEAFNQLNRPDTTLLIVGDGPQMDNCKKLASQTSHPANIVFTGNQQDVLPYLQAMDCFVLPSYANEGVPQALLQAMAVGIPVIACPIGGIPESVKGYPQSLLVEPKNISDLFTAMQSQINAVPEQITRQRHMPFTLEKMYTSVLTVFELANKVNQHR